MCHNKFPFYRDITPEALLSLSDEHYRGRVDSVAAPPHLAAMGAPQRDGGVLALGSGQRSPNCPAVDGAEHGASCLHERPLTELRCRRHFYADSFRHATGKGGSFPRLSLN